jgi:hypothetical protein
MTKLWPLHAALRAATCQAVKHCARAGMGRCLAAQLAKEGFNVVLAALPDALLYEAHAELCTAFPAIQFRKVCPITAAPWLGHVHHALHHQPSYTLCPTIQQQ